MMTSSGNILLPKFSLLNSNNNNLGSTNSVVQEANVELMINNALNEKAVTFSPQDYVEFQKSKSKTKSCSDNIEIIDLVDSDNEDDKKQCQTKRPQESTSDPDIILVITKPTVDLVKRKSWANLTEEQRSKKRARMKQVYQFTSSDIEPFLVDQQKAFCNLKNNNSTNSDIVTSMSQTSVVLPSSADSTKTTTEPRIEPPVQCVVPENVKTTTTNNTTTTVPSAYSVSIIEDNRNQVNPLKLTFRRIKPAKAVVEKNKDQSVLTEIEVNTQLINNNNKQVILQQENTNPECLLNTTVETIQTSENIESSISFDLVKPKLVVPTEIPNKAKELEIPIVFEKSPIVEKNGSPTVDSTESPTRTESFISLIEKSNQVKLNQKIDTAIMSNCNETEKESFKRPQETSELNSVNKKPKVTINQNDSICVTSTSTSSPEIIPTPLSSTKSLSKNTENDYGSTKLNPKSSQSSLRAKSMSFLGVKFPLSTYSSSSMLPSALTDIKSPTVVDNGIEKASSAKDSLHQNHEISQSSPSPLPSSSLSATSLYIRSKREREQILLNAYQRVYSNNKGVKKRNIDTITINI